MRLPTPNENGEWINPDTKEVWKLGLDSVWRPIKSNDYILRRGEIIPIGTWASRGDPYTQGQWNQLALDQIWYFENWFTENFGRI